MNDCLSVAGIGLYHSGVRVGGEEYTFSNDGVFSHTPGEVGTGGPDGADVVLRELVPLGTLSIDSKAVVRWRGAASSHRRTVASQLRA